MGLGFEVISEISDIEIIAVGKGVRIASQLRKRYGASRWRKLKGFAKVRLADGNGPDCGAALVSSAWHREDEDED
jgi:hypothetical protein